MLDPALLRDCLGGGLVIPGQQPDLNAQCFQLRCRFLRFPPEAVGDVERAEKLPPGGNADLR